MIIQLLVKSKDEKSHFQNKTAEGISALQPYKLNYAALQMTALLLRLFQSRLVRGTVLQPLFKTADRLAETLAERGKPVGPEDHQGNDQNDHHFRKSKSTHVFLLFMSRMNHRLNTTQIRSALQDFSICGGLPFPENNRSGYSAHAG